MPPVEQNTALNHTGLGPVHRQACLANQIDLTDEVPFVEKNSALQKAELCSAHCCGYLVKNQGVLMDWAPSMQNSGFALGGKNYRILMDSMPAIAKNYYRFRILHLESWYLKGTDSIRMNVAQIVDSNLAGEEIVPSQPHSSVVVRAPFVAVLVVRSLRERCCTEAAPL
jgi:hypothetical protein